MRSIKFDQLGRKAPVPPAPVLPAVPAPTRAASSVKFRLDELRPQVDPANPTVSDGSPPLAPSQGSNKT
jgi:hypothetical protein